MPDCKACGKWFATMEQCELCPTCERALERLRNYAAPVVHGRWEYIQQTLNTLSQLISKLPYAAWLEEAIETVVGVSPKSICIAATAHDGTTFTGYYNADAQDKAVFSHHIQSDVTMDIIRNNADMIKSILSEAGDEQE